MINILGPNADAWACACAGRTGTYDDEGGGVQACDALPRLEGCNVPEGGPRGRAPCKDGMGGVQACDWLPRPKGCIVPEGGVLDRAPWADGGWVQAYGALPRLEGCIAPEDGTFGSAPCKDDMDGNCIQGRKLENHKLWLSFSLTETDTDTRDMLNLS